MPGVKPGKLARVRRITSGKKITIKGSEHSARRRQKQNNAVACRIDVDSDRRSHAGGADGASLDGELKQRRRS